MKLIDFYILHVLNQHFFHPRVLLVNPHPPMAFRYLAMRPPATPANGSHQQGEPSCGSRDVLGEQRVTWVRVEQELTGGSKWVCLKIAYPYTQWLMIIIPTKWLYMAIIGGIPHFQTYPSCYKILTQPIESLNPKSS